MNMGISVSFEDVSYTYHNGDIPALQHISGDIKDGSFVVMMGHGGAGKSSLCFAVNGLIPRFYRGKYSGRLTVGGRDVSQTSIADLAKTVGLVFQDFEAQLFSTNVELEMAFGPENQGISREGIGKRIDRYLRFVGLEGMQRRDTATLSGGQKQRLAIGSVLAMEPSVLVMDEPTTDLDPYGRERILSLSEELKNHERTLILIDHEPDAAVGADEIWLLRNGQLAAQGTPGKILTDTALLESCGIKALPTLALFSAMGWPWQPLTLEEAIFLISKHDLAPRRKSGMDGNRRKSSNRHVVLEAKDLSFRYPETSADVLQGVNLTVREGEFVAILGQNGSGKSTLARQFNGLLKPTSGEMLVQAKATTSLKHRELARLVGYVFQNPDHQIFASSVREEAGFGLRVLGEDPGRIKIRVEEALAATGLAGYEERSPFLLTKGERQRVAVASILAAKPAVLILDEPTTGLDYRHQRDAMEMLKSLNRIGHTIIVITHAIWIAETYADRTIVMKDGRIIMDGPTREVFRDETRLGETSLSPSPIVRLSNRLSMNALTLNDLVEELKS
ncbi:MAG: energy-coupling factor transporter ATPase [Deltaproteobacteria bacterium]